MKIKFFICAVLETIKDYLNFEIQQRDLLNQIRFIQNPKVQNEEVINTALRFMREFMVYGIDWNQINYLTVDSKDGKTFTVRIGEEK